jgi:hypothetical protein
MKKESQKKVELMSSGTTFSYRGGNYVVVGIEDDKYLVVFDKADTSSTPTSKMFNLETLQKFNVEFVEPK